MRDLVAQVGSFFRVRWIEDMEEDARSWITAAQLSACAEVKQYGIRNVHLWSFCIGGRNALAGVGTLIGLWMVNYGEESTGNSPQNTTGCTSL
mgnify:CR=1 FL=1